MGRPFRKTKTVDKENKCTDTHLNRSISTYGKVQTRMLNDVPNFKWLPSDDSFPNEEKPNVLSNITNKLLRKNLTKTKPYRVKGDIFDSDSDEDFRPKKPSSRAKRLKLQPSNGSATILNSEKKTKKYSVRRMQKSVDIDSENQLSSTSKQKSESRKQPPKTTRHRQGSGKTIKDVYTGVANVTSTQGTTKEPLEEEYNTITRSHKSNVSSQRNNSKQSFIIAASVNTATIQTRPFKYAFHEKQKLPVISFSSKNSFSNGFEKSSERKVLYKTRDCKIGETQMRQSCDVPVTPSCLITESNDVSKKAVLLELKNQNCCQKSLHYSIPILKNSSQNTTQNRSIVDDAMSEDLFSPPRTRSQITSKSVSHEVTKDRIKNSPHTQSEDKYSCSSSPVCLKSPGLVDDFHSTVIHHAVNFEIVDGAQVPKLPRADVSSILQETSLPDIAPVDIRSTPYATRRATQRSTSKTIAICPKISTAFGTSKRRKVAKTEAIPKRLKPVKKNKKQRFGKPKVFSKRLVKKCNKSLNSGNNSVLQQIMAGKPVDLQNQYDFIENSNDAYFIDASTEVKLGPDKVPIKNSLPMNIATNQINPKAQESKNINSNCLSKDFSKAHVSSKLSFDTTSSELAHRVSPKAKCLRKKRKLNYRAMLSGSFHPKSPDVLVSDNQSSNLFAFDNSIHQQMQSNASNENFMRLQRHINGGNVNQRRKQKATKPVSESTPLFTPLHLHFKSKNRARVDYMQSPKLTSHTPSGFRSRSPGSHLRTPIRVLCKTSSTASLKLHLSDAHSSDTPCKSFDKKHSHMNPIVHLSKLDTLSSYGQLLSVSVAFSTSSKSGANRCPSEKELVLSECNQSEPINFETALTGIDTKRCTKLGEGVFGEVFGSRLKSNQEKVAVKLVPIEGNLIINEERQKTFAEVLPEILSSKELNSLSCGHYHSTDGFIKLHDVHCVRGTYPKFLLEAWDAYHDANCSENDRPDQFKDDQLYILLLYSDGGTDVEHYKFRSAAQAFSVVQQVCAALSVAEKSLEFEHRDLHWGNILIAPTKLKHTCVTLDGECFKIPTHGIKASIIDFTLSRLSKGGVTAFQDLSSDPEIFSGDKDVDYQFEIYRMMKELTCNNWSLFCPKSNVFWLHYLTDKFIKTVKYSSSKSTCHRSFLFKCRAMNKNLLDYGSCFQVLTRSPQLSL